MNIEEAYEEGYIDDEDYKEIKKLQGENNGRI